MKFFVYFLFALFVSTSFTSIDMASAAVKRKCLATKGGIIPAFKMKVQGRTEKVEFCFDSTGDLKALRCSDRADGGPLFDIDAQSLDVSVPRNCDDRSVSPGAKKKLSEEILAGATVGAVSTEATGATSSGIGTGSGGQGSGGQGCGTCITVGNSINNWIGGDASQTPIVSRTRGYPGGTEWGFNVDQIKTYGEMIGCKVILQYGHNVEHRDFVTFPAGRHIALIASHRSRKITSLDSHEVQKILSGNVTRWETIGGEPGPIHVYFPSDANSYNIALESLNLQDISMEVLGRAPHIVNPGNLYRNLQKRSPIYQDPYALIVGLHDWENELVRVLEIDGVNPLNSSSVQNYPYGVLVNVSVRVAPKEAWSLYEEVYDSTIKNFERPEDVSW